MSPTEYPAPFQLTLFGGPSLRRTSAELLLSPYQGALLGIVGGHREEGISRSRLLFLLWEAEDVGQARHRFSQLLYATAQKVGTHDLLLFDGDRVLPNSERLSSDVDRFEGFLRNHFIKEAAALIELGFLSRLASPTRECDDWRDSRTLALRAQLRNAAASSWSEAEQTGNWPLARDAAETLLTLHPDSEPYLRCVMKARALCGNPAAAEAAYREWLEKHELGPTDLAGTSGPPNGLTFHSNTLDASSGTVEEPPLVGRREEMRRLLESLRQAPVGSISPVLVIGEPGIGKTRLLTEVCRAAELDGNTVLRARCSPFEQQIPLSPLTDALQGWFVGAAVDRMEEPWRSVIQDILPDPKPIETAVPYIDPSSVSRRLFEAIRRLLQELSKGRTILWIDDFQWADHTTATALEFSLRRWDGGNLVLLISARAEADDGSESSLRRIKSCRPRSEVLEIRQLSGDESVALAAQVIGRPLPIHQCARFLALTDQIPLYVVELAHELSQGRLTLDDEEIAQATLSPPIQQIVDERLATLSTFERRVFELVVVGEELSLLMVEKIIGAAQIVVVDALDRLLNLRLISERDNLIRCKHELIRQGVYVRMAQMKRVALHRRIAEVMEEEMKANINQLALHFDRGQVCHRAFELAAAAARRAEETGAVHEAIRFLRIARRNAPDAREANVIRAWEAGLLYRSADFDQALPLMGAIERDSRDLGDTRSAVIWGIRRLNTMSETGVLEHTEAAEGLDRLLAQCLTDSLWEQYVDGIECRLRVLERANRVEDLRSTLDALAYIPQHKDSRVRCLMDSVRALGLLFADGTGAVAAAEQANRLAGEAGLRDLQDKVLHRLILIQNYSGTLNTRGGDRLLEKGLERATKAEALKIRYGFLEMAGLWHLESAEYDLAEHYLCQTEQLMLSAPEVSDKVHVFGNRAEQLAMIGRPDLAIRYYMKARNYLRREHSWRLHQCINGGLGYCALESGDLRLARECEAAIEYDGERYFDPWMVVLFQVTLQRRRNDQAGAADYLKDLVREFEGRFEMVAIKLRLLECRLRSRGDRRGANEIVEWLIEVTQRLRLPRRESEARMLAASLRH